MVRPELMKGLEAVVGSCITMSGEAGTERIDPCRLHAALMGGAQGYVRSANLEADELEPGESADACSQRGRSVMASKLAQMRLAEGSSAEGGRGETEAHRLSLDPSWSGKMINVTVKVIWPEVVASEFKRGERGREAALEVAVGPDATVSAVKAIVQEREDVPLERQQLVFGGGLQEDARTLASIGVADGHTLFVTVMSGVNVFVKELDGTQHTINIHLSDSVAALKAQMGKLKGWGADAIKLVCAGKLLAPDSASLSSLHVQKEMTIFAIMSDASGTKKYQLDEDVLDASWDYDFTNIKDSHCIVWACDVDGKELAFDRKDSAALEAQYTEGEGRGAVNVRSGENFVDLARMVQVNKVTKVERTVQRRVTNRKFQRALGFEYQRPCGWLRCALKVKGKYAEDRWLGRPGDREEADADEWPVCYHGTASAMAGARSDIAAEGYKASTCILLLI